MLRGAWVYRRKVYGLFWGFVLCVSAIMRILYRLASVLVPTASEDKGRVRFQPYQVWGLLLGILLSQQAAIDSMYGLAGLSLEMDRRAFSSSSLIPKGTHQRKTWYRWDVDTAWQGIRIQEIQLAFYRDKLHTVEMKLSRPEDAEAFLVLLETYLGKGKQDGYAPRYRWQGERASLLYDQNILTKATVIRLESLVLQRQLERDVYKEYQSR